MSIIDLGIKEAFKFHTKQNNAPKTVSSAVVKKARDDPFTVAKLIIHKFVGHVFR